MPRPIQEASRNTPTLRDDLTPPDPVLAQVGDYDPWVFSAQHLDHDLMWRGEGDQCPATYPPGIMERSVRCELIDGHLDSAFHLALRSSV